MTAFNYSDVFDQLRASGLHVTSLQTTGRFVRCKVDGDSEKRGWYVLHEFRLRNGDMAIVGSFGVWHGPENNAQKIELNKDALISDEERAAIKQRLADDKKRADADQKRRARQAQLKAQSAWRKLSLIGNCDYLKRKGLNGPVGGVRFTPTGAMAIPLQDESGQIHGLQFILDKTAHKDRIAAANGRDKQFWPPGLVKKGHYFQITGSGSVVLVAEGYATAATLHQATGLTVVVAWDAGNILPVLNALKAKNPRGRFMICADNDNLGRCDACNQPIEFQPDDDCPHCGKPHKRHNAGVEKANLAALATGAKVIIPQFADQSARFAYYTSQKGKLTDFNDLFLTETLATVTHQVESAIQFYGWQTDKPARVPSNQGGGEKQSLRPVNSEPEMIERFACIYGSNGNYFDLHERMIIGDKDLTAISQSRDIRKRWHDSPMRKVVRLENVGFDPTEKDKNITCNIWGGWPTQPKEGNCDKWLGLLTYMCSGEQNTIGLASWVVKWLAFQLQNPGAKMQTAIVLYGLQGTGKNLLFEYPMRIFGRYGSTIGQHAMEDKFNDWASGKMFIVCNEVVSSAEKYHVKNTLKGLITDRTIRINPKNVSSYEEANHCNLVFLSNERMPVVLEEDDRRHLVIYTPPPKDKAFYDAIVDEMYNGGSEALFHYLLSIDLGDFNEHTKPPMTVAKEELINLSKESVARFADEILIGELEGITLMPYMTDDFYNLYRHWCGKQGVKPTPMNHAIDKIAKRTGWRKARKRFATSAISAKQSNFLIPPKSTEPDPGTSEQFWLGECVEQFREQISQYKGGSRDFD